MGGRPGALEIEIYGQSWNQSAHTGERKRRDLRSSNKQEGKRRGRRFSLKKWTRRGKRGWSVLDGQGVNPQYTVHYKVHRIPTSNMSFKYILPPPPSALVISYRCVHPPQSTYSSIISLSIVVLQSRLTGSALSFILISLLERRGS